MTNAVKLQVNGVGMAAEVAVSLEQHHIGIGRQLPGGRQARDARADHADAGPAAGRHAGARRAEGAGRWG